MQSQFALFVVFAFIGCALSAVVDSAPKSLDVAPLNAHPDREHDLLVVNEDAQPEVAGTDSSATSYRSKRLSYIPGYHRHHYGGGYRYPIYGGGYYGGFYGGFYPGYYGYGGWNRRIYY